jgi:predicted nucleotidyltransferase
MSEDNEAVRQRFERAVDALVETLKQDRTILAAVLGGSLAYDTVWEKSDIDLFLVGDETHKRKSHTLTYEDVIIHAFIFPRSEFKKMVEGSLQGTFIHSFFSKTRLLYTHDDSLLRLYDDIQKVGARDRSYQILRAATMLLAVLPKTEKWLRVKNDPRYATLFLLAGVNSLAQVEVLNAGQIPLREAIHQALALNPDFFHRVYTELMDNPKDAANVQGALDAVNAYMDARIHTLFKPILDYLAEAGGPRSGTEINQAFDKHLQGDEAAAFVCEWLADKGVIDKLATPLRLSEKSRVAVNEAAYYYDGEE